MKPSVSIIIPAWNEAGQIDQTLQSLRSVPVHRFPGCISGLEIIVVDDGSWDETYEIASLYADIIIRHAYNKGKGAALAAGSAQAKGDILVFLDADLKDTAVYAFRLVQPVAEGKADMTIAVLPPSNKKAGFGLVKRLAKYGIHKLSGYHAVSPLSGQRALRREIMEQIGCPGRGFGVEVGLTIDTVRKGYRIMEMPVPFQHRETGRDLRGFYHRGKQMAAVAGTLYKKWREPSCP